MSESARGITPSLASYFGLSSRDFVSLSLARLLMFLLLLPSLCVYVCVLLLCGHSKMRIRVVLLA